MFRKIIYHLISIAIILVTTAITLPPMLGDGLPSYEKGVFHTATIAYYVETAMLMNRSGWWTSSWCCGFQDLIRFYPPLGNTILYIILYLTGSIEVAIGLGMFIALCILVFGVVLIGRELGGSPLASLLLLTSIIALNPWVSTISVYWEYTRILGDGFGLISIAFLDRGLRYKGGRDILLSSIFASLALLTSLITFSWLLIAVIIVYLYRTWEISKTNLPESLIYVFKLGVYWLTSFIMLTAWWLIPAIMPWGLSHYLSTGAGFGEKINILMHMLNPLPPPWTITPPLLIIMVVIVIMIFTKRIGLAGWVSLFISLMVFIHPQGLRLIPVFLLFLLTSSAESLISLYLKKRYWLTLILTSLLAISIATYTLHYYPIYLSSLSRDYTYISSDEYKVATWFQKMVVEGYRVRVYAMYGEKLHGNQWLNVFAPDVEQVLSGFIEGCLDPDVFKIDFLVKQGLDINTTYRLLMKHGVNYLWIDRKWMEIRNPNIIQLMLKNNLIQPVDDINKFLEYSVVYRVVGVEPPIKTSEQPVFLTPARIIGLTLSILMIIPFKRMHKHLNR